MLAVISAHDLGYIDSDKALETLKNIIYTIDSLQKWNGHLYNWYNTETKEPLIPRYISTVDSGNFVGYLYVVKAWLTSDLQPLTSEEEKLEVRSWKLEEENPTSNFQPPTSEIETLIEIVNKPSFTNYI